MFFLREDTDLRTFEDIGQGGVKNQGKSGDFLYRGPQLALNTLVIKGAIHKQMIPLASNFWSRKGTCPRHLLQPQCMMGKREKDCFQLGLSSFSGIHHTLRL